jgi:hypothetical protein
MITHGITSLPAKNADLLVLMSLLYLNVYKEVLLIHTNDYCNLNLRDSCNERLQFCRSEFKDLPRPKGSPVFTALEYISLPLT